MTSHHPRQNPTKNGQNTLVYRNFDLRIRPAIFRKYRLEVTDSPAGRMNRAIPRSSPLTDPSFTEQISNLAHLMSAPEESKIIGKRLRDFLFPEPVWKYFFASRALQLKAKQGLRIRLTIDPPELARLPWEYAYDNTFHHFALSRETPLVRYINEPFEPDKLGVPAPLRILVVIANPYDLAPLEVDAEEAKIRHALAPLGNRIDLHVIKETTVELLQDKLLDFSPDVLHFIGHGLVERGKGYLAFQTEDGLRHLIDADQLMVLFKERHLKIVVLNACQTASYGENNQATMALAPALVHAQIPAVVAMQFALPDDIALLFSRQLYTGLAQGQPLDTAVTEMRISAYLQGDDKLFWGIPTLFMRTENGELWEQEATKHSKKSKKHKEEEEEIEDSGPGLQVKSISGGSNISISFGRDYAAGGVINHAPPPRKWYDQE